MTYHPNEIILNVRNVYFVTFFYVQELARKMEQLNTGNSFQRIKTSTLPHSSSTGALDYQSNMFDRGGSIPKRYSDASLASNSRSASKGPSKPRPTPPRAQRSAHSNIAGRVRRFKKDFDNFYDKFPIT